MFGHPLVLVSRLLKFFLPVVAEDFLVGLGVVLKGEADAILMFHRGNVIYALPFPIHVVHEIVCEVWVSHALLDYPVCETVEYPVANLLHVLLKFKDGREGKELVGSVVSVMRVSRGKDLGKSH